MVCLNTSSPRDSMFIALCGKRITGRFHVGFTFIIGITTSAITGSKIYNWFSMGLIFHNTRRERFGFVPSVKIPRRSMLPSGSASPVTIGAIDWRGVKNCGVRSGLITSPSGNSEKRRLARTTKPIESRQKRVAVGLIRRNGQQLSRQV